LMILNSPKCRERAQAPQLTIIRSAVAGRVGESYANANRAFCDRHHIAASATPAHYPR
jgi:hypothetical protein